MGGGPGGAGWWWVGGVMGETRCESQSDTKTLIILMFCKIIQTAIKTLQTSHFAPTDLRLTGRDKTYWNYKADKPACS